MIKTKCTASTLHSVGEQMSIRMIKNECTASKLHSDSEQISVLLTVRDSRARPHAAPGRPDMSRALQTLYFPLFERPAELLLPLSEISHGLARE